MRDITRDKNPRWKGGMFIAEGYIYVYHPETHPRISYRKYVKRATLVLEQKIGRYLLPNEIAHHINENRLDDRPENLQLMTVSDHHSYHSKRLIHSHDKGGKFTKTRKILFNPLTKDTQTPDKSDESIA